MDIVEFKEEIVIVESYFLNHVFMIRKKERVKESVRESKKEREREGGREEKGERERGKGRDRERKRDWNGRGRE